MASDEHGTPFAADVDAGIARLELDDDGVVRSIRSLVYHYAAICAEERARLLDAKTKNAGKSG